MHAVEAILPAPVAANEPAAAELAKQKLVRHEHGPITLTREGQQQAEKVVRRHRLAERLFHDVMDLRGTIVNETACEFEHHLHPEVEEHVCILLGHPKTCPHGRSIPPGQCCRERRQTISPAVLPLADMNRGERGTIVYLSSHQTSVIQKLMAMGALPGMPVKVIQTFPAMVFQVGQTQVAVDKTLAGDVFVRRTSD